MRKKIEYQLLNHTADIGIKVKGRTLKELFTNAAKAIFEIIAVENPTQKKILKKFSIKQQSSDLQELLVNWLNELLSLSSAKGIIFSRFMINQLDDFKIEALASGSSVKNYRVNMEVKAATYHQLRIEKRKSGWVAEIIFDV